MAKSKSAISLEVAKDGWKQLDAGQSNSIDYNFRFDFFVRRRAFRDLVSTKGILSQKKPNALLPTDRRKLKNNAASRRISPMVSNAPMGNPKKDLTPSPLAKVTAGNDELPVLSGFSDYPSLAAARKKNPALVIAFDSEWQSSEDDESAGREMLTWQFALIEGTSLVEFIFVRKLPDYAISLEYAIGRILDNLSIDPVDIRRVRVYSSISGTNDRGEPEEISYKTSTEAAAASVQLYPDGRKVHPRLDWDRTKHIPVALLCHAGKVDVSGLDQKGKRRKKIMKYASEVQGGLISLQPTKLYPASVDPSYARNQHIHEYPVSLQLADTMCHAPAGMKSLKALGQTVGWEKMALDEGEISNMAALFKKDPRKFFAYASNDSVVTLLYASALYGYNNRLPVTITSAAAAVMKGIMMKYLGCSNSKEFNQKYRGLQTVGHGLVPRTDRAGFVESTSLEPISDKANTLQYYASQAYHGGYNSSSDIGYFPFMTYDYDLQNAYPTAMCLVSDVDWANPFRTEMNNRYLTLQDFVVPMAGGYAPLTMMVAYVRFTFPESVKYPCIPVSVDGIPVYPRTSEGMDGVYACGPELYLALKLSAEVFVERGFILNSIVNPETGKMSYSLQAAVKQLVEDRNRAKKEHGKKSLEEMILKTMVNSGYGKNAQNVVQKSTWTAFKEEMEDLGCSAITNPVSACMITSIVRAELLAAQNQCDALGFMTCSVTTDGFISDIPEENLKSLDLFGIRPFMEKARLYLTDGKDPELWEIKHVQDDLVNFTTRGNVSLHDHDPQQPENDRNPLVMNHKSFAGVCAHNSTKSGFKPDSYEDRLWLMTQVLSRTGTVNYTDKEWTTFKELSQGAPFTVKTVTKHIRMDFDMKRKPDRASFQKKLVPLNGREYAIMNFTTVPFETIAEFREYRQRKATVSCLRTEADWRLFWFKTDAGNTQCKVRNQDWAILNSCIMGHRAGFWQIPKLTELAGKERDAWINSHNTSGKEWKPNDWKNAGRNSRQASMLPREMLEAKLQELMNN